jgi:hypothetical protein
VPKRAVQSYGSFIRLALSKDASEAAAYAKRLGNVLEGAWSNPSRLQPVDMAGIIESFKPRSSLLSEMAEEYLALRQIDQTPPRVALTTFISIAGDRHVSEYRGVGARYGQGYAIQNICKRLEAMQCIL